MSPAAPVPNRLPSYPPWFPALPDGWRRERLDRLATVSARIGWKALTADEYVPEGFAFLSTPNIKGTTIDFEDVNYISEFRYFESPELRLQVGDVLLAKDGSTLGIVNLVRSLPRPATVNGSIAVIRPNNVDPGFLCYYLASRTSQGLIEALKGGMGVPHLFQFDLNRIPVATPPISIQRAITSFLDRETARIDALVLKVERLRALLKDRWRSSVHSATTRGLAGLAGPTEVRETNVEWLGMVPIHWRVMALKRLAIVRRGASPRPIDDPNLLR